MSINISHPLPHRLTAFIDEHRHRDFNWGDHDCCLFIADWILARGDRADLGDIGADYRGQYTNALGAMRAVKTAGFDDLTALFDALLGPHVPPLLCRRGDVVLIKPDFTQELHTQGPQNTQELHTQDPQKSALGIAGGDGVWGLSQKGVVSLPASSIQYGWPLHLASELVQSRLGGRHG
ncbi:hypothetical protein [uncultured Shewanella sp.]|uniref:DUF6950 family protein n=1 Tax=uncultured Shewanella sp. TaxID=173975 RepID=UPI0026060C63|nr:hypothetical protein [uncultured Shewanella sp.]